MKKKKDIDEFLKKLEEAIESVLDDIESSEKDPVAFDISISVCPMIFNPEMTYFQRDGSNPVDILETEKNIHVLVGMPGMDKRNIELNCTGWTLEILAKKTGDSFEEIIELPARANKTGMRSTYEKGILEVVVNKSKSGRKRK